MITLPHLADTFYPKRLTLATYIGEQLGFWTCDLSRCLTSRPRLLYDNLQTSIEEKVQTVPEGNPVVMEALMTHAQHSSRVRLSDLDGLVWNCTCKSCCPHILHTIYTKYNHTVGSLWIINFHCSTLTHIVQKQVGLPEPPHPSGSVSLHYTGAGTASDPCR